MQTIWKWTAEDTQKKSQDCVTWTFLSKALTSRLFENHLSSIFICRFVLYPISRPSIFFLQNLLASSVHHITSPGLLSACKAPPLPSSGTKHSELTYWCRRAMAGLVFASYKCSPPENAGHQRTELNNSHVPLRKHLQRQQDDSATTHPPWNILWSSSYLK